MSFTTLIMAFVPFLSVISFLNVYSHAVLITRISFSGLEQKNAKSRWTPWFAV